MPEWRALLRARLSAARLRPTTEMDVVDELTQHLDDRYAQALADGLSTGEAEARSLQEVDGEELLAELLDVLPREE